MTYSDRDGSELPADAWGLHGGPHETWGAPAGLPLHEATDRDGDNVPSGEERMRELRETYFTALNEAAERMEKAEATIARVEALAFEWDADADANDPTYDRAARALQINARELLAALRGPEPTEEP